MDHGLGTSGWEPLPFKDAGQKLDQQRLLSRYGWRTGLVDELRSSWQAALAEHGGLENIRERARESIEAAVGELIEGGVIDSGLLSGLSVDPIPLAPDGAPLFNSRCRLDGRVRWAGSVNEGPPPPPHGALRWMANDLEVYDSEVGAWRGHHEPRAIRAQNELQCVLQDQSDGSGKPMRLEGYDRNELARIAQNVLQLGPAWQLASVDVKRSCVTMRRIE